VQSRPGKFKPQRALYDARGGQGEGIAVDANHDVFWSASDTRTGVGAIVEFPKGVMPGHVLAHSAIGAGLPGSVLLDRDGNLLLVNATKNRLLVFAPPYDKGPAATIALNPSSLRCAFGPMQTRIFCLNYQTAAIDVYAYPQGTLLYSYWNGLDRRAEPVGISAGS